MKCRIMWRFIRVLHCLPKFLVKDFRSSRVELQKKNILKFVYFLNVRPMNDLSNTLLGSFDIKFNRLTNKHLARGCKFYFILNSTEHEISTAHKTKMLKKTFLAFKLSDVVLIMLVNVKIPTIIVILTLISNYLLS